MRSWLGRINQSIAARFGVRAVRVASLYPWQRAPGRTGPSAARALPAGAEAYLRRDHPRLAELERRYAAMEPRVTTPASWRPGKLSGDDLLWFRGDNAFVWQVRSLNLNELAYALCYYHFLATDEIGLLSRLDEDGLFGVHGFALGGRLVSRDLLDSAREIQFLTRHAGLGSGAMRLLDIGAGYGRLAHRLHQAFGDEVEVFSTDAVAAATFIAEYHLGFRGLAGDRVVPLDEVEALLASTPIDLAVNVHSFAECTPDAVLWWVERLALHRVRWLFVVPGGGRSQGTRCEAADGTDLEALFSRLGYRPRAKEPRYSDPVVQRYGLDPVWLHLFELG